MMSLACSSQTILAGLLLVQSAHLSTGDISCSATGGQCTGSSLLQRGFESGRLEKHGLESHLAEAVADSSDSFPDSSRMCLQNFRVGLKTAQNWKGSYPPVTGGSQTYGREHQRCRTASLDGRLWLCGHNAKFLKYFKFENVTYSATGVPIFDDGSFDVWLTEQPNAMPMFVEPQWTNWCTPDHNKPFVADADGNHIYSMRMFSIGKTQDLTVTVANPNTDSAQITNVTLEQEDRNGADGEKGIPIWPRFPRGGSFTSDGKLYIGQENLKVVFVALPESEEPCARCPHVWSKARFIHEMFSDPDGLNLANRYPIARHVLKDSIGTPFTENYKMSASYITVDPDGRNFYGDDGFHGRGLFLIGEDTQGEERMVDDAINRAQSHDMRGMVSTWYNFDIERTTAHRFEGEMHSTGYGATTTNSLPVSPGGNSLPMFDGWKEFYTESSFIGSAKPSEYDILYLNMAPSYTNPDDRSQSPPSGLFPDISGNHFHGQTGGTRTLRWDSSQDSPDKVQGCGFTMEFRDGWMKPDFSSAVDVPGLTSPAIGFTALVTVKPFSDFKSNPKFVIHHQDLKLSVQNFLIQWQFMDQSIMGGFYELNDWTHLALVYDGIEGTVTVYKDGVPMTTSHVCIDSATPFQLNETSDFMIGRDVQGVTNHALSGNVDRVRLLSKALSPSEICDLAEHSSCAGSSLNFTLPSAARAVSQQARGCTDATVSSLDCAYAFHKLCSHTVAALDVAAGVSPTAISAVGGPVSAGGVAVQANATDISVACTPNANQLNVPVEWRIMQNYNPNCTAVTTQSSNSLACNIAAKGFCAVAHQVVNATGLVYKVDMRAWVTCFPAASVITQELAACAGEAIRSSACELEAAQACSTAGFSGGVIQGVQNNTVVTHCFNSPASVGVQTFAI